MKAESTFKSVAIPSSGSVVYNLTGTSFYIYTASGTAYVQFDDGNELAMVSGMSVESPEVFTRLTIRNADTSTTLNVTFYAGTLSVKTLTPYIFTKPAPTYLKGTAYTGGSQITTAADTTISTTNLRTGKTVADTRSHVIISAMSSALYVKDSAGTICGFVQTFTSWQITTKDTISLRAVTASTDAYVANFFNFDS